MLIDQVHDLQYVYRRLLHSLSRPGTISSIQKSAEKVDHSLPCFDATLLCAMTLLDAEVSFHILPNDDGDLIEKISEYTLANYAPITEADYIFVLCGTTETMITGAMEDCKIGTLINPEHSATWIMESKTLTNHDGVTLSGPGIKHTAKLHLDYTVGMWNERNERTKEYPLGIDLIFVDNEAQITGVPRTSIIEFMEVV
ncbi:phosphonate C-P lyase system protein PhnH [Virgibacillus alimentarius]|uniref:Alpha-D-ribose 1-methylphosphonate 5-triphosphate synthase subunit PhnH n=1 Tax=Virgibacillus alimentarius TaxID=698769 RepID=A0ABS4S7V1_9BACI|nr:MULTISPECIES: phosphonate C-P lyase system protein PhnH [Virgibacillus]MBP2257558.1 alpha-D-ribose 1-methylphosphonate 5-triphosphate synthase subunit PhnH [Virgibacillus alimentarius]HLR68908.1 phosphonate C-P lyase system protein PhnH [Virgibacillus sp.]